MSVHPNNWKKSIYLAKFIRQDKNGFNEYSEPIQLNINHQPVSAETAQKEVGVMSIGIQKAVLRFGTYEYDMFIQDKDESSVAYLDGASPTKGEEEVEESYGDWANYKVIAIRTYNLTKHVYFEKIGGR